MAKSQSQRIRFKLYILWWKQNRQESFDEYYMKVTENIIKKIDSKIGQL